MLSAFLLAASIFAQPASAGTVEATDTFLTKIPASYTLEQPLGAKAQVANLGEYVNLVYRYALGIVGIIATVFIMAGGLWWMNSNGNEQSITQAKEIITSSIVGLAIALFSYSILYLINPKLLSLDMAVFKIPIPPQDENAFCTNDSRLNEEHGAKKSSAYKDTGGENNYSAAQINNWITTYNKGSSVSLTFLKAIMQQESRFNFNARSNVSREVENPDGTTTSTTWHACGLMQVLPTTAKQFNCPGLSACNSVTAEGTPEADVCCDAMTSNPEAAICAGVRYVNELAKAKYADGNEQLMAAAYNGGPGAIKYSKACPGQYNYQCSANKGYAETRSYVPSVMDYKKQICQANRACDPVSVKTKAGTVNVDANGYCVGTDGSTTVYAYAVCQGKNSVCPSTGAALRYTTQPACQATEVLPDGSLDYYYHAFSEDKYYGSSTTLYSIAPHCENDVQVLYGSGPMQ